MDIFGVGYVFRSHKYLLHVYLLVASVLMNKLVFMLLVASVFVNKLVFMLLVASVLVNELEFMCVLC